MTRDLTQKQLYQKYKNTYLKRDLKIKYNITLEDYDKMFKNQNGCCAICGIHQEKFNIKLAVDHNHTNGKVRGLLCHNCNVGMGSLKDSIEVIKNAIEYLNKFIKNGL